MGEEDDKVAGEQHENSKKRGEHLLPYQFKPGQSGNPSGRPHGKSLKEYAKEMLLAMTDEERQEFLKGLPKDKIWEMAEGKAAQDLTSGGEKIAVIPIIGAISTDNSNEEASETKQEN